MNKTTLAQQPKSVSFFPSGQRVLQRKCACGKYTTGDGQCAECSKNNSLLQRKLVIGASNDPLEYEADRIADAVLSGRELPANPALKASGLIQRIPCPSPDEEVQEEEEEAVTETSVSDSVPSTTNPAEREEPAFQGFSDRIQAALSSSGKELPAMVRKDMGERMGTDFSKVRIHTDSEAARLSSALDAHAFTYGSHIFFNRGKFDTGSREGLYVLAHELAHTIQQNAQMIRRLSVSSVGSLISGPCGRYRKRWDFTLGAPASNDGYIVQQVDFYEDLMNCPSLGRCPAQPSLTFWEAWPVAKGDTAHTLHTSAGYTDQSSYPGVSGKPGYVGAFGEIKFYLKSVTGDLGSLNTAPATPSGGWGPGAVSQSGSLPSTSTRPSWWSSSPTEGPGRRSAYAGWRCCPTGRNYNIIRSDPP